MDINNKKILSIDEDDDEIDYKSLSIFLNDDALRNKNKFANEFNELGEELLAEIDEKKSKWIILFLVISYPVLFGFFRGNPTLIGVLWSLVAIIAFNWSVGNGNNCSIRTKATSFRSSFSLSARIS